ncbi:HAMP domain-containing sensor histidine kinase [Rhabdobacter roseus]|uniref:histidine kinase n=1 Tax=Rhabdobacter roseus TaxID=1655419 RepID=A0A840TZM8_9BACT|nr:HAMP domain-containing sensor histidine kinase [Rhabdobacter roseus]MBB5286987.1 signal transduction histidine kinase [Rhabdobacter roseus]
MKLIHKATRSFLIACLLVAGLGGVFCFFLLKKIFSEEATEQLYAQKKKLTAHLHQTRQMPENWYALTDSLAVVRVSEPVAETLTDTLLANPLEPGELLDYRILTFGVSVLPLDNPESGTRHYKITIQNPIYETEDLSMAVFTIFAGLIAALVLALLLVNYWLSNRLWLPFYKTLDTLSKFKINEAQPLTFAPTSTNEFQTLQTHLDQLTRLVRQEYASLKTFTENASHELQTPLAVISSNLEQLLQAPNLTQSQLEQIGGLLDTTGRLARMNQTLLLLTKIDNRQFGTVERVDFSKSLGEKLTLWEALIEHKGIKVDQQIEPGVDILVNPHLADVMLNNLLTNAIKHNLPNGRISVALCPQKLIIRNTGNPPTVPVGQLWERFQKDSTDQSSLGLGLALVAKICQSSGFQVSYEYAQGWHEVVLAMADSTGQR